MIKFEYTNLNDLFDRIVFDLESELIILENSDLDYETYLKFRNDIENKLELFTSLSKFNWECVFPIRS